MRLQTRLRLCFFKNSTDSQETLQCIQSTPFKVCSISHGLLQLISSVLPWDIAASQRHLISCRSIIVHNLIYHWPSFPCHLHCWLGRGPNMDLLRCKCVQGEWGSIWKERWADCIWTVGTLVILCTCHKDQGSQNLIWQPTSKILPSARLGCSKPSKEERKRLISSSALLDRSLETSLCSDLIWHQ